MESRLLAHFLPGLGDSEVDDDRADEADSGHSDEQVPVARDEVDLVE